MASELDVSAVGKEFVRQYYTVLNQRPDCLHLFFTEDSSFVHGGYERPGEEKPASKGQSLIHQKVLSLGFHDCRTKILQVDCQKTIGNAVLVQVSGELSKSGEAMRRFMQSFVLVQQSMKNFYVHNDIFRYQDEVFVDSTDADETAGAVGESKTFEEAAKSSEKAHPLEESAVEPALNDSSSTPIAAIIASQVKERQKEEKEDEEEEGVEEVEAPVDAVADAAEQLQQQQQQQQGPPPKGFSWASMASKNVHANFPSKPQAAVKPERKTEQQQQQQQGVPSNNNKAPPSNKPRVMSGGEEACVPVSSIADNQQLFIGNLPHNVSENEIKELFERYGAVLNVKVNRKGNSRDVPNFGFVAFDSHDAVVKALKSKPIMLNGKRRINIEEKKDQTSFRGRPVPRAALRPSKE